MIDSSTKLLLTEKSLILFERRQYTFLVNPKLTKPKIKSLIEKLHGVKVETVNTLRPPRKKKDKSSFKKAMVTLKPNFMIPISPWRDIDVPRSKA